MSQQFSSTQGYLRFLARAETGFERFLAQPQPSLDESGPGSRKTTFTKRNFLSETRSLEFSNREALMPFTGDRFSLLWRSQPQMCFKGRSRSLHLLWAETIINKKVIL